MSRSVFVMSRVMCGQKNYNWVQQGSWSPVLDCRIKNETTVKRTQCPLRSPTSPLFRQIHVSVWLSHLRAAFFVCFSKWWTWRAFLFFPSTDQTGRHQRVSCRLHCLWRYGRVLACSHVLRTATPTSSRHDITGLQHLSLSPALFHGHAPTSTAQWFRGWQHPNGRVKDATWWMCTSMPVLSFFHLFAHASEKPVSLNILFCKTSSDDIVGWPKSLFSISHKSQLNNQYVTCIWNNKTLFGTRRSSQSCLHIAMTQWKLFRCSYASVRLKMKMKISERIECIRLGTWFVLLTKIYINFVSTPVVRFVGHSHLIFHRFHSDQKRLNSSIFGNLPCALFRFWFCVVCGTISCLRCGGGGGVARRLFCRVNFAILSEQKNQKRLAQGERVVENTNPGEHELFMMRMMKSSGFHDQNQNPPVVFLIWCTWHVFSEWLREDSRDIIHQMCRDWQTLPLWNSYWKWESREVLLLVGFSPRWSTWDGFAPSITNDLRLWQPKFRSSRVPIARVRACVCVRKWRIRAFTGGFSWFSVPKYNSPSRACAHSVWVIRSGADPLEPQGRET